MDNSNGAYSFVRLQARVDTTGSSFFNIGGEEYCMAYTKDKNGLVPGTSYRAKSQWWIQMEVYRAPSWTVHILYNAWFN